MDDLPVNNLVVAAVIFAVYMFIMVALYFLLSSPIDAYFDSIEALSIQSGKITYFMPYYRTGLNIAFAIGIATPIAWIIFWVYSREPDISVRRYR